MSSFNSFSCSFNWSDNSLDEKNKNLEAENTELNQLLDESDNKYNELQKDYETNINEKKAMNVNLQNLNKDIIELKEKNNELNNIYNELDKKYNNILNRVGNYKKNWMELKLI